LPGASVSRLAREHGINANQVFAWRKAYQEGQLWGAASLPVTILSEADTAPVTRTCPPQTSSQHSGLLVLERDGARLTIEGQPDVQTLKQLFAALLR
jgi:transposase